MNEREEEEEAPEITYDVASAKDAARLLRVSEATVWRWVNQDIVPAYRVGRKKIRFKRADLEALIRPARRKKEAMTDTERLNLMAMAGVSADARDVMARARALRDGIMARRGGERMTESWEDINEAREARSADL